MLQNLFHSWKSLLCELSRPLANEPKFQDIMAVAATNSLRANANNSLPEAIFEKLALSRAKLAFTLLQRLLEVKSTEVAVYDILSVAWDTARMYNPNVGAALGGADADYYRMLLKILYLALQVHTSPSPNLSKSHSDVANSPRTPESATQIALEIVSTVVAQGFRTLTILLHENSAPVRPSDFALLTAILRSALHVPNVARNTTHLLNAFSDFQTARCASTLLSWSDQLATSGDPIYGELSILFLLEISSVPSLAELLATEGVLSHILSTNLIRILRSRPFGPFDQPPRMYSIWTRAILPLLLNLLHSVGPPLAAEVAAALNNFPHQLDRASGVFATTSSKDANADYITLSIASEAVTLSLIVAILHTFREAGSSAAIVGSAIEEVKWDKVQVKEDVEAALQNRRSLRERITPTKEREEAWSRAKPTVEGSEGENKLEEKIVEEMRSVLGILEGNGE
jgi:nuclear pore complex protein Nup188